jgi:hypothetical protein
MFIDRSYCRVGFLFENENIFLVFLLSLIIFIGKLLVKEKANLRNNEIK